MAAKKRLWLVRRDIPDYEGMVALIESESVPTLNSDGYVEDEFVHMVVKDFCHAGFKKHTGISIPKGHVVPVESITFKLAGKPRKAKVAK